MAIAPIQILELARQLHEDGNETKLRSSVSRSYYATLHLSLQALPSSLRPAVQELHSKGSHQAIISAIDQWGRSLLPGRTAARQAVRQIQRLKAKRIIADYDIGEAFDPQAAEFCIDVAQSLFEALTPGQPNPVDKTDD